jgi:hypothetical protein
MVITTNAMLTWCRVPNNRRAAVIAELAPGGLQELEAYTSDEIREAIKGFKTLSNQADRFNLTALATKRITQLALWVKDRVRLDQAVSFPNGTSNEDFNTEIAQSQQREDIRKTRKKAAESLATLKVDPILKSSAGWEVWLDAIRAALTVAYGEKGVPLLYVIREDEASTYPIGTTWEELAIAATPLGGLKYDADRQTVHLFILNNVAEDSDAYAYIYPLIGRNNGRLDMMALSDRYENDATIQARVNQANKTWDVLVYKNERAMSFETFCKKLTKTLQHFDKAGRAKHNGDVIDWIWSHVQSTELSQLLSALKVSQSLNPRTPLEILHEIAKEIPNISKGSNFQPRVSEVGQTSGFTFDGDAPANGAHNNEGKLFCGSYHPNRWFSDELKPFRDEITKIRQENPGHRGNKSMKGNGKQSGKQTGKQVRRKVQQLKKSNEALNRKLSALKAKVEEETSTATGTNETPADNAGDAFGGRDSMRGSRG